MQNNLDAETTGLYENLPAKLKGMTPLKGPLTPETLRQLSGKSDLTDEEAEKTIHAINVLTKIFLALFRSESKTEDLEEAPVIHLECQPQNKAA